LENARVVHKTNSVDKIIQAVEEMAGKRGSDLFGRELGVEKLMQVSAARGNSM
jgi:hypothetical protein